MNLATLMQEKFGRLSVIAREPPPREWSLVCQCDCGMIKRVYISNLRHGRTLSCGCWRRDMLIKRNTTHGLKHRPEYTVWRHLLSRCQNPTDKSYLNYGGRGITVDPRWHTFENFFSDMGPRPTKRHTLERKNNQLGYSAENCTWSTRGVQARNTRRNRMIAFRGQKRCMSDWARRVHMNPETVRRRLRRGWTITEALTTAITWDHVGKDSRFVSYHGERHSVSQWATIVGLPRHVIFQRLRAGWPVEKALTTPKEPRTPRHAHVHP